MNRSKQNRMAVEVEDAAAVYNKNNNNNNSIITREDILIIKSTIGPSNQIFSKAPARIYIVKKGEKRWSILQDAGVLSLYQCIETGILYFSLVDMNAKCVAWNQEIYLNFKYFQENNRFHSFEGDTGIIGFLFISTEDSEIFYTAVMDQLEKTVGALDEANQSLKSKSKKKSILSVFRFGKSSKSEKEEESAERHKRRDIDSSSTRSSGSSGSSRRSREGSSSRSSSIDSRSSRRSESSSHRTEPSKPKSKQQEKEKDKKKKENKSTELSHEDVSEPRDFRHLSHIGFNPEKGTFDIKNIPDDWKTLFAKAGITQDQLENRSTANFIAGFVEKAEPMMNSSKQMKKKPPPPPPPSKSRQPQPQPQKPQSQQSRTSVPPPPPPKKKLSATPAPPPPPPPMKREVTKPTPNSDLMNSIRNSGGSTALKPVSVSVEEKNTTSKPSPQGADPHSALMASIRSGSTALKPVKNTTPPNSPTRSTSSSDPTDMMAAMLAKALAARNKKLAVESSEDEDEDSNW